MNIGNIYIYVFLPKLWRALIKKTKPRLSSAFKGNLRNNKQQHTLVLYLILSSLYSFSVQQGDVFFLRRLSGRVEPSWRGKERTNTLFDSVYRGAPGHGVKYQNHPSWTEEALSRLRSILVLHDPLPVDVTSWTWSSSCKCIISDRESWKIRGFRSSGRKVLKGLFFCASSPFGKAKVDCSCVCSLMKYWNEFFFFSFFFFYILIPNWSLSSPSTLWHWVVICNLFWLCAAKK